MEHGIWSSSVFLLMLLGSGKASSPNQFEWTAGPWGACEHVHCGYGGKQYREVWCQLQGGASVYSSNCAQLPKPSDVKDCYKICDSEKVSWDDKLQGERWSAESVVWSVSQWSRCKLDKDTTACGKNNGVRYRTVVCERRDSRVQVKESECESQEPKPEMWQRCELLCRQDCIVTLYSNWSTCDRTCHFPNQTRTRRIVVPPRHGGKHCPAFSEMIPCDNCTESYTYSLEPWNPCGPIETRFKHTVRTHPLIGYQSRMIKCLQNKGSLSSFRHCTEKIETPLLHKHQSCIIPQDCKVSSWSQLQPFNSSCMGDYGIVPGYMIQTRTVLQVPLGEGRACPTELQELVKLEGKEPFDLKPCKSAKWILSGWSVCKSVPGYSHCGKGIQSRKAICVETGEEGVERPVEDVRCPQPKPLISQGCDVECNWDCSVSQWTAWSSCLSNDCEEYVKKRQTVDRSGKRHRIREVLTLPGPGGKTCPHLSETQACFPGPCYSWNITLSDCLPSQRGGCGIGHRTKTAACKNRKGERVSDSKCWELAQHQEGWEDCYVACPNDCVMSDWGAWSVCPEPCQTNAGPNIRVRERSILAKSGKGGQPCQPIYQDTQPCPTVVECTKNIWKTTEWGHCLLDDTAQKCGRGVQQRGVTCYTQMGQPTSPGRCEEQVRPKASQTCILECPKDCLVTEWSDWSSCGVTCLDSPARQIFPKQRRQRYILQYPENGGAPCPNSLFEERNCLHLPPCDIYKWDMTGWSDCILPPKVPYCGEGLRARNITCKHANRTEQPINTCLLNTGAMPKMVERCYVSCQKECQITDWSPWSPCVRGCTGYTFRTRKLLGPSRFAAECKNLQKYPLDEQKKCQCSQLQPIVIGGWSDCILEQKVENRERFAQKSLQHRSTNGSYGQSPSHSYCGAGTRYKAVACRNGRRDMERAAKCSRTEYEEEVCIVPCPMDCEMTEWSEWLTCSVTCGSGIKLRFRSIATQPADGGRKCPLLDGTHKETQSQVCQSECRHHMWEAGEWGSCKPMSGTGCGSGTQSRQIRCKAVSETTQTVKFVDDILCRTIPVLLKSRSCYLPCPGDCVLSEWTQWSPCQQPCNGHQSQRRTRKTLRKPASYYRTSANDCTQPEMEERACIRGDNCIEYSWQLSDWASCLVNGGFEECGVGHKERYAWCRDEKGRTVERFHCEKLFGQVTEPLVVSCEIPCNIDCLLSDWSDWSPCSRTCGLGVTKRYRTIVQNPEGNGRMCPSNMEQSKPCFQSGCYKWVITDWSQCFTQRGVCGSGIQMRNVSCIGEDGLPVDTVRCSADLEKLVMKTEQACHVPCPGECMLSAWTSWSECHLGCEDFHEGHRQGVKVRSRAVLAHPGVGNIPCSDSLWEELVCHAQRCYSFYWAMTEWTDHGERDVWCQRSDGLNVTGGCDLSNKPSTRRQCIPSCDIPNSRCIDTNVCSCDVPYEEIYGNGSLTACVMDINQTTTSLTPVSTLPVDAGSNIWMYAVIAVGTIFVISVAAALYNMCELFRTGPRPRRRDGKSAQSSLRSSQNINEKNAEMDALYKQCSQPTNNLNKDVEKLPENIQTNQECEQGDQV